MGRRDLPPLRSLPRVFVPGADPAEPIELPPQEVEKLRKVLRLSPGAQIAVLPNDGRLIRCEFSGRAAVPLEVAEPEVEPRRRVCIAQALPKPERLEDLVRACTEIGVCRFVVFPSERTVVRWDEKKLHERLKRLAAIAREAAELSFRTRLPAIESAAGLEEVLEQNPRAVVLSEAEGATRWMPTEEDEAVVVVGPEGGWSPRELALIGDRGVTLGPRVLRVDHAAPAAAALLLLSRPGL